MGSAVINSLKRYFTITVTKTGNGTVTPDVSEHIYQEGTTVPISIVESDLDYYHSETTVDAIPITVPYDLVVSGNHIIAHTFLETIPYLYSQNLISVIENDPLAPTTLNTVDKNAIKLLFRELWAINATQSNFFRPDAPSLSVLKAIYPFLGNNKFSKRWNLVNPLDTDAAYRITWNNPNNYTFDYGVTRGNGVDANGDTHFIHSNLNGAHFSTWLSDFYDSQSKNEFGYNIVKAYFLSKYVNISFGFSIFWRDSI